jgi:hypothetical protein
MFTASCFSFFGFFSVDRSHQVVPVPQACVLSVLLLLASLLCTVRTHTVAASPSEPKPDNLYYQASKQFTYIFLSASPHDVSRSTWLSLATYYSQAYHLEIWIYARQEFGCSAGLRSSITWKYHVLSASEEKLAFCRK